MLKKYIVDLMSDNPLNGKSTYKDTLNLATGDVTRHIKKLLLTGEENWSELPRASGYRFRLSLSPTGVQSDTTVGVKSYCSHLKIVETGYTYRNDNAYTISDESILVTSLGTTDRLADWKQFLADQYAAGTPVILWYTLETAETSSITVPAGLSGTVEGYTTQTGAPTPINPIYPTANTVTMWANYTPQKYSGTAWQAATGQPEQYNGGWT